MIVQSNTNVLFKGRKFTGGTVRVGYQDVACGEFGKTDETFIFDYRYDEGGSFFTTIPISSMSYRRKYGDTSAKFDVADDFSWMVILDDHGSRHHIQCEDRTIIAWLVRELRHFEVPQIEVGE